MNKFLGKILMTFTFLGIGAFFYASSVSAGLPCTKCSSGSCVTYTCPSGAEACGTDKDCGSGGGGGGGGNQDSNRKFEDLKKERDEKDSALAAEIALIVGGQGNNKGAIIGTIVLLGVQQAFKFISFSSDLAPIVSSVQLIMEGLVLIIILRYWPSGLLPEKSPKPPKSTTSKRLISVTNPQPPTSDEVKEAI